MTVDYLYRWGDRMKVGERVRFRLVIVYVNIYALLLYNDRHEVKLQNNPTKQKTWVFRLMSRSCFNTLEKVMILCGPSTVYIRYFVATVQFPVYAAKITLLYRPSYRTWKIHMQVCVTVCSSICQCTTFPTNVMPVDGNTSKWGKYFPAKF